jgi:hypothetical protein
MKSKKAQRIAEWKVEKIEPAPLLAGLADLRGSDIAVLLAAAHSRIRALEMQMSGSQADVLIPISDQTITNSTRHNSL